MAVPVVGAAKMAGGAVAQVGIQLALEKAFFNKDVQQTTKNTESAFSKSFGNIKKFTKNAFNNIKNTITSSLSVASNVMKNSFSSALNKVRSNFEETFNKISTIMRVALVAGSAYAIKFGKDAVQAASDTQAAWTGLFSIVNGTGKSFSEAQGFLKEYVNDGLIPLTDAVTAYKTLAARGYEVEQIEGIMERLKDAAAFNRQSSYTYGEAIKSAAEGLKNENSILVDNAGITKNVAKMWEEYAEEIGTTANNLTLAQKRQAEYNGIMKETQFQLGDAATYANTYAGQVAKLSTAFYNLKTAVGSVVAPVLQALLPAITAAVNGLTKLFNKLQQVMSVFGYEWKEYYTKGASTAIDSAAESTSGLSDGLESAGKTATATAKKIKKAFAGVDEINVLNTSNGASGSGGSNGSGGTGGAGAGTGGSSNDAVENIGATGEWTKKELEWLNRSAYDWGVAFGEAINNGFEKIPWDKIQKKVVGVVSKVAEFLNGAVEGLDWHLLGSTLGEGFNTVLYGLNTFFKVFDWDNLGKGLGESINGIFDSVDWKVLGEYLGRKFSSTFQVLSNMFQTMEWSKIGKSLGVSFQSMIDNIDWKAIGDTISKGFNGAIQALFNFAINVNWTELGKNIYKELDRTIKNIDWQGLGITIATLWNSAFEVLGETVGKKEFWTNLGDKMVTSINALLAEIDWKKTGTTVSNFVTGITGFITNLLKNVDWEKAFDEFLDGVDLAQILVDILEIKFELKKMKWQAIGKLVVDGIWDGIKLYFKSSFEKIGDYIDEWFIDPWKEAFDTKDKEWYEIGSDIIAGIFKGIAGFLKAPFELAKTFIFNPIVGAIKAVFGISSPAKEMEPYGEYIIEGLLNGLTNMKKSVTDAWNKVKGWFTNFKKTVSVEVSSLTKKVKDKWNSVKSWFKGKSETISAKVASLTKSVKDKWKSVKNWFKGKSETISAKVGSFTQKLKNSWNNLLSNFKGKQVEITAKVGGVVGNFKSTINDKIIKPINKKLPSFFPQIPYLAQGGWLKANNPQLAVVGDNKHEPEIVAPESKIYEQTKKAVEDAGGSATQNIEFTINVKYEDGKSIIKKINSTQIQDGKISLLV